jgi:hypothetical protein
MGHACAVTKEILDDGAPDRDPWLLRWSREDSFDDLSQPAVRPGSSGSPGGQRRRWLVAAVAGVVLLGGGWFLRDSAGELESPTPEISSTATGLTSPIEAGWAAPVLRPGATFTLTVQTGDRLVRIDHGPDGTAHTPFPGRVPPGASGWATATATVVVGSTANGQRASILDTDGRERLTLGPALRILPGAQGWSAWLVRAVGSGRSVQGYGLDGAQRGPAQTVPSGTEPVAVLRDGVILSGPGDALSLWRPGTGDLARLEVTGRVVSAAQGLLLVADGQEQSLVNVLSGRVTRVRTVSGSKLLGEPVLSRDGLRFAVMVEPDTGDGRDEAALAVATVFDGGSAPELVPGTRYRVTPQVSAVVQPAWSLDGLVFGYSPGGAGLYAFQPGEAGAQRLPVPGLGTVRRIVAG